MKVAGPAPSGRASGDRFTAAATTTTRSTGQVAGHHGSSGRRSTTPARSPASTWATSAPAAKHRQEARQPERERDPRREVLDVEPPAPSCGHRHGQCAPADHPPERAGARGRSTGQRDHGQAHDREHGVPGQLGAQAPGLLQTRSQAVRDVDAREREAAQPSAGTVRPRRRVHRRDDQQHHEVRREDAREATAGEGADRGSDAQAEAPGRPRAEEQEPREHEEAHRTEDLDPEPGVVGRRRGVDEHHAQGREAAQPGEHGDLRVTLRRRQVGGCSRRGPACLAHHGADGHLGIEARSGGAPGDDRRETSGVHRRCVRAPVGAPQRRLEVQVHGGPAWSGRSRGARPRPRTGPRAGC